MASIAYKEVYSRFFTKAEAYDLIDEKYGSLHEEFLCNWLHSSVYYPHIRKLFSSVAMDDKEETITYDAAYSIDDATDAEFILDVLSYGMVYAWVQPKVDSITAITQTYGTGDEKFYSQAQHLSELRSLRDDMERKIRSMTSSRGFFNNQYLDGKSASAKLKVKI